MTKERLKKYTALKRERDLLLERIEEIDAQLYKHRTQNLSGMPTAHDVPNDHQEALIEKKQKVLDKYTAFMLRIEDELLTVETAIEAVEDPTARELLRLKYIDGLTWEEVCVRIGYEWTHTHRLHARALEKLKEKKPGA